MDLENRVRNEKTSYWNRYNIAKQIVGNKPNMQKYINQFRLSAFDNYKGMGYTGIRKIMEGKKTRPSQYVGNARIMMNTFRESPTGRGAPPGVTKLWRGLKDIPPTILQGYLQNKSFSSWSSSENPARLFGPPVRYDGIILELNTSKMKNIPYINYNNKPPIHYKKKNDEAEFLLPPQLFMVSQPNRNKVVKVLNIKNKNNIPK
jgi:hypothetical protein